MTPEALSRMVALFIDDSARQLDALADDLTLLAENPQDHRLLERCHRAVHTIKGSASMLALRATDEDLAARLEAASNLAGVAEERFRAATEGELGLTDAALDVLHEVPSALTAMLRETEAGRIPARKSRFDDLARRISATGPAASTAEGWGVEPPSQEELEALFEADAAARPQSRPAANESLTSWLGERVPSDREPVPPLRAENILDELEEKNAAKSAAGLEPALPPQEGRELEQIVEGQLTEGPESTERVSLSDYRGGAPPPPALPAEGKRRSDLDEELREAARLLGEEMAASPRTGGMSGPEVGPPPGEARAATEDEGRAVLDALAIIIGADEQRTARPEDAAEAWTRRTDDSLSTVGPPPEQAVAAGEAASDEQALADLLELAEEGQEEVPSETAQDVQEERPEPAAPSGGEPQAAPGETGQTPAEEETSLAELLGLEDEYGPDQVAATTLDEPREQAEPSLAEKPTDEQNAMRVIFLEEARQLLDDLNQDLVALEGAPGDAETLRRVLRAAHTLKGSAATVGYERISTVAHRMEDLLQLARDRGFALNSDAIDSLLGATDCIDELAQQVGRHGEERGDIGDILARLEAVERTATAPAAPEPRREPGLGSVSGIAEQVGSAEMEGLREVFVQEARDLLDVLGRDLVVLEQQPDDAEAVHRAMRTAHTLKGSAAMLECERICTLAHAMEDALHVIRDAKLTVSSEAIDLMLGAVDLLEGHIAAVARTGQEDEGSDIEGFAGPLRELASALSRQRTLVLEPAPVVVEQVTSPPAELHETFLEEAHTRQTALMQALVALEQDPADGQARTQFADSALALTGSAAALGFQHIADVAGHMEAIVQAAKERDLPLDAVALDALGEGLEALMALLVTVRGERHDRSPDVTPLIARFREVHIGGSIVTVEAAAPIPSQTRGEPPKPDEAVENRRTQRRIVEVDLDRLNQLMNLAAELIISRTRLSAELTHLSGIVDVLGEQGHALSVAERRLAEMRANGGNERRQDEGVLKGFSESEFDRFSDMDVVIRDLRDSSSFIGDLSGEFANMASNFDQNITRISTIAKDLHDEILRVRMTHVERAFTRIPRIIRDAARNEGKRVNLILEGAQTEIDKNILEAMNNPLLHLLRNSVGHGIETPEEREARGKPAAGKVTVRAAQEGNQVIIEVSDDGRGIDPERIRRAAVERGMLSKAQADALSDAEVTDLIFEPGLSTSEQVSELSGRGVGLDVVRSVVNRFNGTVSVESAVGQGTTFRVALPLTLAIGQALLVEVAGWQFALPLPSVSKIEQVGSEEIVVIKDHPYIYRDDIPVPVIRLGEALGIPDASPPGGQSYQVVLVQEGDRQSALVVDRIVGREDIVIKTLGSHLRRVPGISGATILGDGSVVMILNVPHILSAISTAQRRTSAAPTARATERAASSSTGTAAPARRSQTAQTARGTTRERASQKQPPMATAPPRKVRILVVDDSISIRKYVTGVLERGGYETITANDGADAWEKLQAQDCGLIISDLEMPRMHGYELIAELKKNPKTRQVPVVFLTARAGEKHKRMGAELGAAAFLNKPFSEAELLNLVRGFVR